MFSSRRIRLLLTTALVAACQPLAAAPRIAEFLASNVTGLKDEDGDESDWIEIHNPNPTAVNLEGWGLSDNSSLEEPWLFPAVTLNPGARLVVFASGKNRRNPLANLHTGFSLDAVGEYLALLDPAGTPVSAFSPAFPAQLPDVS